MEIFIEKQLIGVAYSLILGLIFGAVYDIIRLIHIICNIASYSGGQKFSKKGVLPFFAFFLLDIIYSIFATLVFSVFVYYVNYGDFRWFLLAGAAVGFTMYYFSLGRVVMYFSERLIRLLKKVLHYTVAVPVRFVLRILSKVAAFIYKLTLGRIIEILAEKYYIWCNDRYAKHIISDLGLLKNSERKRDNGWNS